MKAKIKYIISINLFLILSIFLALTSLLIEETNILKIILTIVFLIGNSILSIHFIGKYKEEMKDEKTKEISVETRKIERKQQIILGIEQLNKVISMLNQKNFDSPKFDIVAKKMAHFLNEFLDIELVLGNRTSYNTLTFNRVKYQFGYYLSLGSFRALYIKEGGGVQNLSDASSKEFMTVIKDYFKKEYQIEI